MRLQEDESKEPFASRKDQSERQAFVKELHLLKTDIFMRMVESGMMPLRPGVKRLVGAALQLMLRTLRLGSVGSKRPCTKGMPVLLWPAPPHLPTGMHARSRRSRVEHGVCLVVLAHCSRLQAVWASGPAS